MKKFFCAVTFAVVLVGVHALSAQVQGQWAGTGTMQSARESNAQVLMLNGNVLSMGGIDNNSNVLASAEVYSSAPGTWVLTGSLAAARELFPAVLLANGRVLVSGGLGAGSTVLSAAELYDPATGAWSPAGSLSVARFGHTATLLPSGKVLVAGGCTATNCSAATALSELYDPLSNSWSPTGSLNAARAYHNAVRLGTGKVLAIGPGTSCELYDPVAGSWSNAASTNVPRSLNTATLLADGKVLVTGGANGRFPINSAELYDPNANSWTPAGSMTTGRYAHTATLQTDGTVLLAGGYGQSISCGKDCTGYIPTAKAEIYNETAGKFTATALLSQPRAYHSATLLAIGRPLVAGGSGTTSTCCIVLSSAAIYTPLTMTFSATSLNFGVLQIGLSTPPQMVTVTNVSSHSVTFKSIAASGDFSQTNTCPSTLTAGQNCVISVTFTPLAPGTRNGGVTLVDNEAGSPSQTITLTGIGAINALTLLPGLLKFPAQTPGTTTSMSITLYNDGAISAGITAIGIFPPGGTFTQTNDCPAILNAHTSCVIQVSFTPPDAGNFFATVRVTESGQHTHQSAFLLGQGANN